MRDKYIDLIINYVKEKPGYEQALEDIKKEVLAMGANEAEFDEAMNRILTSKEFETPTQTLVQHTTSLQNSNQSMLMTKFLEFADTISHLKHKKQYFAVGATAAIILFFAFQLLKVGSDNQTKNATLSQNLPSNMATKQTLVPVVYASSLPVDAERIFSIKSGTNVPLTVTSKPKKEVLGFFPYWMMSNANDITLNTLTDVSLFGLETDAKGNILIQGSDQAAGGWAMWQDPNLDQFITKARSYGIKIELTIKSFDNGNIEGFTTSDSAQQNLIANVLYLVNSKNLDGVNIDFEYIGSPSEAVKDGFTRFITNLNTELKRQNPNSTLTIDTYLVSGSDNGLFDIPILGLNSDAFVIMGYDMHTPSGDAGPVSAMGGDTNIIGYVQNFLEKVDASKIILAVPYYGYAWPTNNSGDARILPYAQIAQQSQNAQLNWDDTSQTPSFTYKDDVGVQRTVYYDNVRSLGIKYDFINKKNLKGVGIWALGYDGNNQDLQKLLIDKFINQ